MSVIEAVIQAVVQGLSEFLPVSSSGHLSVFQHYMDVGEGALLFSVVLHLGTLVAVFAAFRTEIAGLLAELGRTLRDIFTGKFKWSGMNGERRMLIMMVITILMLFPFYIFKDFFESVSTDNDIIIEGFCFLYTSALLFTLDRWEKGKKEPKDITVKNAVTVGIFQGIALLPGVSRSGSTISGGVFSGFTRELAVRYSFIMGIPVIMAGALLEIKDAVSEGVQIEPLPYIIGFIVAAATGLGAIRLVQWLMKSGKFRIFAVYTLVLGILVVTAGILEQVSGKNLLEMIRG